MVAMYAEHRYGDVQILILIVDPGEPTKHVIKQSTCGIVTEKLKKHNNCEEETDWVVLKFTV